MAHQRVADVAARARQDVDHARREDLGQDLGERQGRQRRPGGRLEHDRVARGEGRAELPAGHVQRVVPWGDGGDDADRIAPDDGRVPGHELVGGQAVHDSRSSGKEAEQIRADGHLVDGGTDGLARVRALEATELVGSRLQPVGDLEQQQRAVLRR